MRRRYALLLASCLTALAVAGRGTAQPGELPLPHLHFRDPEIPVNLAALDPTKEKPAYIQLWSRQPGMRWQAGSKHALDRLPAISGGRNGFKFIAPTDGEYEFAVQFHYADSTTSPREADLRAIHRAMIDTVPPGVEVRVNGKSLTWRATDTNRLPTVLLQCKWAKDGTGKTFGLDEGEWFSIEPKNRGAFRPDDAFDWTGILPAGQELWVRVLAKDQAGNDGFSPPVRVPGNGTFGTAFPKPNANNPDWPPSNPNPGSPGLPKPPQPRIEYVSSPDVTVDFTLRKVGRSGVQAFHLYSQTQHDNAGWKFVEKFPRALQATEKEQPVSLKYKAEKEGLYGFYVIAESGAGYKLDPPGRDESPMMFVVVDWTKPYAKLTGIQARPGGVRGPLVDITWEVADPNLMPRGISLEYSVDRNAPVWKPIGIGLDNDAGKDSGRHTWEVPDENLWKFWVRIRAVDKAANTGEHVWEKEVIVDLEKPSGVITGVRGGNNPPPRDNNPLPMNPTKLPDTSPKGPTIPDLPDDK